MSTSSSYWNDERLNKLAAAAAANVEAIAADREAIAVNREAITVNRELIAADREAITVNREAISDLREQQEATNRAIDILVGIVTGHQERFANILEEIRDIKVDIKGLQLENKRMLEEMRSRRDDEQT